MSFNENSQSSENCINFAEWACTNLFDPRYLCVSYYKRKSVIDIKMDPYMFNYPGTESINGLELYKIYCKENGLTISNQDEIDYYEMNLKPLEFLKFIIDQNLFLYKYRSYGVEQPSYWTNKKGDKRLSTSELYKNFTS